MKQTFKQFQHVVWEFYDAHGRRELPWRLTDDPYRIMVSELMLQQTQVNRVIEKYRSFLERFPDVESLAAAPLGDVLIEWQGLGYNRRAKFLWLAAQKVVADGGKFPDTLEGLVALPGVGVNTAGAILAYAYNREVVFIETNIRTVFIHHFFNDRTDVSDAEIRELVEATLPKTSKSGRGVTDKKALPSPLFRDWYWALMDYGTHVKQLHGNKSRHSKSYNKQSKFEGSWRQIRGAVIRRLSSGAESYVALQESIGDERLDGVLAELVAEGMIAEADSVYRLA